MRNVLIIAYSFPPAGGGRVRRAIKFAKYLKHFNWEPVVLTVKKPAVPDYDYALLDTLAPDLEVIRTPSIEIAGPLRRIGQKARQKKGVPGRLINGIRDCTLVPDSRVGWIPFAVLKGLSLIRNKKIDVILVMAEPYSSLISGAVLKLLTGKPLVLDFRDEWVGFNDTFFSSKSALVRRIEERMEAFVVKKADAVISVTEDIINNFRQRYPSIEKERFVCITNGFDPDDYAQAQAFCPNDKFVISYAGCLYKNRSPRYFLEGVSALINQRPDIKERIKLRFIGSVSDDTQEMFAAPGLNGVVEYLGFLPFDQTLRHLCASDALLYIEDQVQIFQRLLPAKIFEYLALKKPIIAMGRSSLLNDIIKKSNAGRVVSPDDPDSARRVIEDYFAMFLEGNLRPKTNEIFIRQFERRHLTEKLSRVLDTVSTKR
jgi:glycosyltransferase involved in cell wall biosynthesis